MNISKSTEADKAKRDHASTLGLIAWLTSAALLLYLHHLSGYVKPKWTAEILDMLFYVVEFFWIFLANSFIDFFHYRLLKK